MIVCTVAELAMSPASVLTRGSSSPGQLASPTSNSSNSLILCGEKSRPARLPCCRMRRASILPRNSPPPMMTNFLSFRPDELQRIKVWSEQPVPSMLAPMPGLHVGFAFKDALLVLGTAAVVAPIKPRLKVSPVLGYLAVGVLLGPSGLGRLAERS